MASPSSDGFSTGTISAEVRSEILQELADIASTVAKGQIEGLTARLSEALLRVAQACTDAEEAKVHRNAAELLKQNRYPFFYVASERLATALQNDVRALEDPSFAPQPVESTLPPDVEIDKKLCLIKASRAIESEHADRMAALNTRLAHVLGREQLTSAQNPFRPLTFLSVIHEAWCEFQPNRAMHHLVFPLLQPRLCLEMAPILHALNTALIKRGVRPTLNTAHPVEAAAPVPVHTQPEAPAAEDALTAKLRSLFPAEEPAPAKKSNDRPLDDAFPTLFLDEAVQATASRNELLEYLSGLQQAEAETTTRAAIADRRSYATLGEVPSRMPRGFLTPTDEKTFALVAKVFDTIFAEKAIPDQMKELIGMLQLPAVKAALIDKDFFFVESFPARRSIELLARLSLGWDPQKGTNDPLYLLIQRSVKRIQQESDHRISVFADVVGNLEAYIKREESAAAQAYSTPISHALQQEKLQQATKAAKHEVSLRIGTGEVVAFVETFLEDKWVSVLTLAYTVKDEKPQAVDSALRTMDDLCWSVKPKITPAERKDFLSKLPPMLAMLNKWLDLIKWNDEERTRFFAELARAHASIVRAPLELSPERQMQIALQVAKKAAERRMQRQASQKPEPVPDEFDQQAGKLQCGTWIEFRRSVGVTRARLAWVSPMHSYYIFSTRERQEAVSMSAEELANALRTQRAHILSVAGLIGRALASALGVDEAGNDAEQSAA